MLVTALAAILILAFMRENASGSDAENTPLETRLQGVLSQIEGVGRVRTMVRETDTQITGVLIVCEGAETLSVRLRVQEAAKTLLGIENEKISVVKMGGRTDEGG